MIEKPDTNNCTIKQWEKWWWQEYNLHCQQCANKCKQSWIVQISCTQFKKENMNV